MSVDDSVSSSRETTESRSESLPRDRVEKIRFSSEPPRRSNDDHLCTPTETDNRSSQASSYIESFMIPDEEDWVMWDKKIVLSCSKSWDILMNPETS